MGAYKVCRMGTLGRVAYGALQAQPGGRVQVLSLEIQLLPQALPFRQVLQQAVWASFGQSVCW